MWTVVQPLKARMCRQMCKSANSIKKDEYKI